MMIGLFYTVRLLLIDLQETTLPLSLRLKVLIPLNSVLQQYDSADEQGGPEKILSN